MALPRQLARRLGPSRAARLGRPGYLLLPLRLFLGVTFCFAGLQKLANPAYLDRSDLTSVYAQMQSLQHRSPIEPLVALSTHAPTLVGLLIAFGELAVGVGTLLGLLSRTAATGGALLALSFFLTVSWNTTPYYYGSDIVFLFAWITMIAFGSGDVLSLDAWLRNRARRRVGLSPEDACSLSERLTPDQARELGRRTVLATGAGVAGVGLATALVAGATAAVGRANHHSSAQPPTDQLPAPGTTTGTGSIKAGSSHQPRPRPGTAIASTASVPVGHAERFLDPRTRRPAWLVHPSSTQFVAFSAICTHAGCTVGFDAGSQTFVCPCHGGTYDARTGRVLSGPPPAPLPKIAVRISGGEVFTA